MGTNVNILIQRSEPDKEESSDEDYLTTDRQLQSDASQTPWFEIGIVSYEAPALVESEVAGSKQLTPGEGKFRRMVPDFSGNLKESGPEFPFINFTDAVSEVDTIIYPSFFRPMARWALLPGGDGGNGGGNGAFDCTTIPGYNLTKFQVLVHEPDETCKWVEIADGCE